MVGDERYAVRKSGADEGRVAGGLDDFAGDGAELAGVYRRADGRGNGPNNLGLVLGV